MNRKTSQLKSHEKIFIGILLLLVVYIFADHYIIDNQLKKNNKKEDNYFESPLTNIFNSSSEAEVEVEEISQPKEKWNLEYEEFWKDPEWREKAKAYLEKTGNYDSSPQSNYTREQKRQYVVSLIQSLSKSDIRILNDYLGYIEGGYYFETTGHNDYPSNPEALRYIQLNIYEVIDLLSE